MFDFLLGFFKLVVVFSPFVVVSLSLLLGLELCLSLSLGFVVGHLFLHVVKKLLNREGSEGGAVGWVLDGGFFVVFIPLFYFFVPAMVLDGYGMVVNFCRILVLVVEGAQVVRMIVCVGHLGAGEVDVSNSMGSFLTCLSVVFLSISGYLFYSFFSIPELPFFFGCFASGALSSMITILVVVVLYRLVTSSSGEEGVKGNALDVSLLFLFISYLVWVSYSESPTDNFSPLPPLHHPEEGEENLVVSYIRSLHTFYQSEQSLEEVLYNQFNTFTTNTLASMWGGFSCLQLFSLSLSLVSVVGMSFSITESWDEEVEMEGVVYDNLLQSLTMFLFTNILLSLSSNLTFSLASGRMVEAIVAGLVYGLMVCAPMIQWS